MLGRLIEATDTTTYGNLTGTAIDLEDKAVQNANKPVWEQVVTDDQGRRRFHGAFTGGFSAGYYNTVGSAEGWTPSQFQSSRLKRAKLKTTTAEDIMDEEDKQDMIDGGRQLTTTAAFTDQGLATTATELGSRGVVPDAIAQALFAPANIPIGMKLLYAMKSQKETPKGEEHKEDDENSAKVPEPKRVYGLQVAIEDLLKEEKEEGKASSHAARNTKGEERGALYGWKEDGLPQTYYSPKNNFFGIGYDPSMGSAVFRERQQRREHQGFRSGVVSMAAVLSSTGHAASSGAFGVGAFEDDDDIDVYSDDTLSNYNRELVQEGSTKASSRPSSSSSYGTHDALCSDGSLPLSGFVLQKGEPPRYKQFPPPTLPAGFRPAARHFFTTLYEKMGSHASKMDSRKRALILGEKHPSADAANGSPVSVFDLMSPEDRARLKAIAGDFKAESKRGGRNDVSEAEGPAGGVPYTGYNTFGKDEAKQMRYRNYLLERAGKDVPPMPRQYQTRLAPDVARKEREEFEREAQKLQKVPNLMAGRFTTASSSSAGGDAEPEEAAPPPAAVCRKEQMWFPERLVCKRFNVPNPYPNRTSAEGASALPSKGASGMGGFSPTAAAASGAAYRSRKRMEHPGGGSSGNAALAEPYDDATASRLIAGEGAEAGDIMTQKERPPIDLFRAIFEESEEEEKDHHRTKDEEQEDTPLPDKPVFWEDRKPQPHYGGQALGHREDEDRHKRERGRQSAHTRSSRESYGSGRTSSNHRDRHASNRHYHRDRHSSKRHRDTRRDRSRQEHTGSRRRKRDAN